MIISFYHILSQHVSCYLILSHLNIRNLILFYPILFYLLFLQIGSLAFLVTVPKEDSAEVTEEHSTEVAAEVVADVAEDKEAIVEGQNGSTENTDMES